MKRALAPFRSLKNPHFAQLYAAQTISLFGDALTWVGLALLAFELAGENAAAILGTALTLRVLAFVLLSPLAGALADRINRKVIMVGDRVPDFTLINLAGEPVYFSDLEGQAVVLNFWATWCPPCRREMPLLDSVQQAYAARGLTIVGVDLDEPAEVVKRYVERIGVQYPIWTDAPGNQDGFDRTRDLYTRFRGVGLPTTIFIAPDGNIRGVQVGELNRGILQSQIEAMLPEN